LQVTLAAELLIHVTIARTMRLRNDRIQFGHNACGKPYLKNDALDLEIVFPRLTRLSV